MKRSCLLLAFAALAAGPARAQETATLAPTPPMGWNTWNAFQCECSEALVRETADAMVASGMRDAGYAYLVIDDCWAKKERDLNGNLVADPVKFPGGMKALAAYVHAKGLKFGIYGCAGSKTCAGYPGGRGHEFQDARTYASWDVDYLKYDWCNRGTANGPETYRIMGDALRAGQEGPSCTASASGGRTSRSSGPPRSPSSGARRGTSTPPTSAGRRSSMPRWA